MDPCIVSSKAGLVSPLCEHFKRCMYAAPRDSFTSEENELLDAWGNARVCLLAFSPHTERPLD